MDTGDPETESPVPKTNWKLIGVVALAMVSAGAGFFAGRIIDPPDPFHLPPQADFPENSELSAEAPLSDEELAALSTAPYRTGTEELTVQFPEDETYEEFRFETRSSVFSLYGNNYGYELRGTIAPISVEIESMTATVELLAEGNRVVLKKDFNILPGYRKSALPGDSIPLRLLIFEKEPPPALTGVRILLRDYKSIPIKGEIDPGKEIPLATDETEFPPGFSLELNERSAQRKGRSLTDEKTATLHLGFTFKNNGQRKISSLRFMISLFDKQGNPMKQILYSPRVSNWSKRTPGEVDAVHSLLPALLPGEKRALHTILYVPDVSPEDIGNYRISLVKIE